MYTRTSLRAPIGALLGLALVGMAYAQAPAPAPVTFIKGTMDIRYATRTQLDGDKPKAGVEDVYTLNVNVSNSARFVGTISQLPYVKNTFGADQRGKVSYAVDLDVVNPANPSQTRNVGKLSGTVPVDDRNVYSYGDGTLKVSVFAIGNAKGFDSTFKGIALGKPPAGSDGILSRLKKEALSITKSVGGKAVSISVTQYDQMVFQGHVLAAGPVQIYPEATVNGTFLFDYERSSWYLQNVIVTYPSEGRLLQDNLSGNIRWLKGSNEYEFDIRVNEAPPTEQAIFSGPQSEADFFSVDNTATSLTDKMGYKDTVAGSTTISSSVAIDLKGNKLTKAQSMYLAKLVLFSLTGPLNSD